ncbi:hypothetical protein F0261_05185 [Alteromonas sp. 07-89-2]|uniref:hypothetical protein n=1 Tax=Alteromonas sp. 07-89-2 TaxID=2607609 RepID=UPI00148B627C|nr:hypothetical protein [Alteromonas sp. 07-89-2]NOH57430.1 hypothetical protein [Alteromonas sp. 07-89-2]
MSVICTVDRSEYWQQLCGIAQNQVIESLSTLTNTTTGFCYVQKALSIDEIISLISTDHSVTVVVPPPFILLQEFLDEDHQQAQSKVQKLLDDLYSLYKKHRSAMGLIPLSAFCVSSSIDTSSLPWLEKSLDSSKVSHNLDSVICHSLFNQNANMIKAYKKLQSCFSLRDEESVFYPDIAKLKQALTQDELDKSELAIENGKVIEQNLLLLDSLENKVAELSSQKEKHTQEADRQLAQFNSMRKENENVEKAIKALRKERETQQIEYANFVQSSKKELTALEKTKNREIKQLESKLEQKSQVEQTLRAELAELRAIKSSKLWKVSSKVEKLSNAVDKHAAKRKKLSQDMSLLYTSELFDADWYLETYSDVQKDSIDPAEHYLLYGANEGRKPSPYFDGKWYLQANPDVASENTNPLIHYIKFGREEKRPMSPVMITHKKK